MFAVLPKLGRAFVFVAPLLAVLALPGIADPTRILPLGDSITAGALAGPNGIPAEDGGYGRGGYRYYLERFLEASDGLPNFEIIGNSPDAGGTIASFAGKWFLNDKPMKFTTHGGYPGFSIEQIRDLVADGTEPVVQSDVVLLQVGTNNVGYGSSTPATAAEIAGWRSAYESLLDAILAKSATARVVMAKIPPVAEGTPYWDDGEYIVPGTVAANAARIEPFNTEVVEVVHADYAATYPGRFFLVDNFTGLDPENEATSFATATNSEDFFTGQGDGIHPYNAGHRKMAVGFWNGYQRAQGKAATAVVTPLDDPDGDGVGGADVGLLGDGTLRQGDADKVTDQPYVMASTDPGERAKLYLRLDLSGLPKQWDEARFNLIFWGAPSGTPNFGNCCDDQPSTATFEIHGIPDGGDDWTEEGITWATAPGNDPGGDGVTGTFLGGIVVPGGLQTGEVVSISTPELLDFVNHQRGLDGMVTFAVTGTVPDPGFRVSFQDSDLRDYAPAFLQLADSVVEPAPADFRILSADFDLEAEPLPEVEIRFVSDESQTYLVSASDDLRTFDEVLASGIPGAPGAGETTIIIPMPDGRERLVLRVERQ